MGLFVYFFIPETKGISLEKMDELFGVTSVAKAVDDVEKHDEHPTTAEVTGAEPVEKA